MIGEKKSYLLSVVLSLTLVDGLENLEVVIQIVTGSIINIKNDPIKSGSTALVKFRATGISGHQVYLPSFSIKRYLFQC